MRNFLEGGSSFPKRFKDDHVGSYNILQANKISDLLAKIAKAIKNDWQPVGGPSLSMNFGNDNDHHWPRPLDVYGYIQGMVHSNPDQIAIEKEQEEYETQRAKQKLEEEVKYNNDAMVVVVKNGYYEPLGEDYTGRLGLVRKTKYGEFYGPVLLDTNEAAYLRKDQFEVIGSLITTPEEELLENLLTFPNNSETLIATDISGSMGNLEEWISRVQAMTKTALPKATRVCFADKVYNNGIHTDKYLQGPTNVDALIKYYESIGFKYMIVITDGDFDTNGNISYKDNFYLILPEKWIATKHRYEFPNHIYPNK